MSRTWEDDCADEWERLNEPADIDGCKCRGGPNVVECEDCREIFCADCMEHKHEEGSHDDQ